MGVAGKGPLCLVQTVAGAAVDEEIEYLFELAFHIGGRRKDGMVVEMLAQRCRQLGGLNVQPVRQRCRLLLVK